ncbi:DUF2508 family protein [Ferroacidibacillus organovorans]|uniref:DUF2508 domain-containing protein n=2 Tax=Ferroacidibacillus organovorans TaxID=1765683 RepID=A0A853KFA7_9BACL|nr:DUF2508 family protein [Ferroacidibacillus organovorans]KYP81516.1 hypothetical protein AYJ22_07230 [Ferroacidibacillus organovorans]OAG94050.1 hypothetical protein AYW79_07415 [Ferroacidibacillus organovorans]
MASESREMVNPHQELLEEIAFAKEQLQIAREHFDYADGQDAVDDAIYLLSAAEMRYEGLLRIAKHRGLMVDAKGRALVTLQRPLERERIAQKLNPDVISMDEARYRESGL